MKNILKYPLISFGEYSFTIKHLLEIVIFIIAVLILLQIIKKIIFKTTKIDYSRKYSIFSLLKYFILVFAAVVGLQILDFNVSVLIAGSAALLVGLGLGLQNLFSDFISGIIILFDSTIKVGDIIDVSGLVCKVEEINLRTTTVLTRDDKYIILPNTDLTRGQIINWSHSAVASRFEIHVGVDYSSDVKLVMELMQETAKSQKGVEVDPAPFVRFVEYGDSSLNFTVYFWSEELFRAENIKSDIRVRLYGLFKQNGITIPFPQRVIHMPKQE